MSPRALVPALALAASLALAPTPTAQAQFQAGAAVRTITPNPLLPISGGMGPTKPAREARGELTARAVVFKKGDVTVAFVGLDLLGFPSVLGDRVRAKVPGIPPANILIGATHTHSAPEPYAFPDGKGGHTADLAYLDLVCNKAADAVNEALSKLKPATLKIATGEAQGKIAFNYYAPDLYDKRMSVIQAAGPDGKTIATVVNYAIHPEVLGNSVGILSPDLIGPLCDTIEATAGGTALFMNGAQGGMITADNRAPAGSPASAPPDLRTWDECQRIGRLMASEALRLLERRPHAARPRPSIASPSTFAFPVESEGMWAVIDGSPLKYPHNSTTIHDHTHASTSSISATPRSSPFPARPCPTSAST